MGALESGIARLPGLFFLIFESKRHSQYVLRTVIPGNSIKLMFPFLKLNLHDSVVK